MVRRSGVAYRLDASDQEDLSAAHLRLSRTYIESLDWATCIEKYDREHSLTYCDPPYWAQRAMASSSGCTSTNAWPTWPGP